MAVSPTNRIIAQTLQVFASTGMDGTLQVAAVMDFPILLLRIINASTKDIIISYDGVHYHDYIVAGTTLQIPFAELSLSSNYSAAMSAHTTIYVTGVAGTGNISFCMYYQPFNNK